MASFYDNRLRLFLLSWWMAAVSSTGWVSLVPNVPQNLTDERIDTPQAPILFGTPPQILNLSIDLLAMNGGGPIIYASNCTFCPGPDSYNPTLSSTAKNPRRFIGRGADANHSSWTVVTGNDYQDTVSLGNVLSFPNTNFLAIDYYRRIGDREPNGYLPLLVNSSSEKPQFLLDLWKTGNLQNPVIGVRLDGHRPRLSFGALDPSDYQGQLNWVSMNSQNPTSGTFSIDGIKGYNGSFLPNTQNFAYLDSAWSQIGLKESTNNLYFSQAGYIGPDNIGKLWGYPADPNSQGFALPCVDAAGSVPSVPFTVTINGVDYPLGDMYIPMHGINPAFKNQCTVTLRNATETATVLGGPFLRSVYVAYRFPTDSCPGYYGFAFLSDPPYPVDASKVSQQPKAKPPQYDECLANIVSPTSTPSPTAPLPVRTNDHVASGSYYIWGEVGQAPLWGVEDLPSGTLNRTMK